LRVKGVRERLGDARRAPLPRRLPPPLLLKACKREERGGRKRSRAETEIVGGEHTCHACPPPPPRALSRAGDPMYPAPLPGGDSTCCIGPGCRQSPL